MKKLLIFSFVFVFTLPTLSAQVSFSCDYRESCYYSEYTESYSRCGGYEEPSLFIMNEDETMFTHTTETIKSTYYVKKKKYDSENDVFFYYVTSDVGNEYIYCFDVNAKEIRILIENDEDIYIIKFRVKSVF